MMFNRLSKHLVSTYRKYVDLETASEIENRRGRPPKQKLPESSLCVKIKCRTEFLTRLHRQHALARNLVVFHLLTLLNTAATRV